VELSILQVPPQAGSTLMAEDLALLEQAELGNLAPTLRFYEWSEPTISLGFHQNEEILDRQRLTAACMPWVRRPTGGAAVLHSDELTYSIIIPNAADAASSAHIQELVSRAIVAGLRAVGVDAETDARGEPLSALPNRSSCFVRTSRWEVAVCGKKIVGSAQRKLTRALLQHGSILTGDDHLRIADFLKISGESERETLRHKLAEKATSVAAELGRRVAVEMLRAVLADSFAQTFQREMLTEAAAAHSSVGTS
jgi:lipoyl(octanoyl) transferase